MLLRAAVLLLLAAASAAAQVQSRPTDAPLVTAASESWYQLREPINFAGDFYYPAGAVVFFDGNEMARIGHYNGVPIYTDTTIEPYSVILVPVRRGLMQPYERRRQGDLVGTTGSRTPSFPVRTSTTPIDVSPVSQFAVSPTEAQQPIGAISAYTPGTASTLAERVAASLGAAPSVSPTPPAITTPARQEPPIESVLRPESNDGLWVRYGGAKWLSAGAAVPLRAADFRVVGDYAGFPVFMRASQDDTIYLPTRAGLIAPYRRKD
jgi:hypothetical protein